MCADAQPHVKGWGTNEKGWRFNKTTGVALVFLLRFFASTSSFDIKTVKSVHPETPIDATKVMHDGGQMMGKPVVLVSLVAGLETSSKEGEKEGEREKE